jgi:hypothetical protein
MPLIQAVTMPKVFEKMRERHGLMETAGGVAGNFVTAIDSVTNKVPQAIKQSLGNMAFLSGAGLLFTIPSMVCNITKSIASSSLVERVKSAFKAVVDFAATWMATNSLIMGLKSVGVLAAESIGWAWHVSVALLPLQILNIGLDVYDLNDLTHKKKDILANITVKDITKSCTYIEQNHESLRKTLGLSKATDIAAKARELLATPNKEKSEKFVKTLRRRINTKFNLEVSKLASKVGNIVMGTLSLFIPLTPATLAIGGLFGLSSLLLFGLEKLLINKDPFSEPKDVWYSKAAHKIREGFGKVTDAIEQASIKTSRLFATRAAS